MELIDGNSISKKIIEDLKKEVAKIEGTKPGITFIRVGEDPGSITYVNRKQKMATEIGMVSNIIVLPAQTQKEELFKIIDNLNQDPKVHGILVQAPLPKHLVEREIFNRVAVDKDVDGFSAANLGKLCQDDASGFIACTPAGILELLKAVNVEVEGKHVVILGRSLIVGKPAALLMMRRLSTYGNATVTVCHSKSKNISNILKQADIVIAAIGKPKFIKADMLKKGVVVIDVGINRPEDPETQGLVGDVDFENVSKIASKISPVPGGVGPMTVAMLMKNTLKAYYQRSPINKQNKNE